MKGRLPPSPPVVSPAARQQAESQRMVNLAMELGVAGAQILREQFGFSEEQTKLWFDAMLLRAQTNRQASVQTMMDSLARQARDAGA